MMSSKHWHFKMKAYNSKYEGLGKNRLHDPIEGYTVDNYLKRSKKE